jgi:serine protease Do
MRTLGENAERLRRSTVQIFTAGQRGGGSGGSGILWRSDGLIVTNAHVLRGREARVELWDGRRMEARVLSRDARRDVATLRIAAEDLDPATPGDSANLRPGDLVMAVGNPLGFAGAVSSGVVHSIGGLPGMGSERWIRADVRLAPGNSGGPLADARGEVVGVNTAIVNGLGVALPVSAVKEFLLRGPRPALGATLRPLRHGLLILDLEPDGAASRASLQPGDVLLSSMDKLTQELDSGREVVRLRFLREDGRKLREVSVRLDARAEAA